MLIDIEGLDGSGKTTQVEFLRARFLKTFRQVEVLKFPVYDSPTGEVISSLLRNTSRMFVSEKVDALVLQALMVTNRLEQAAKLEEFEVTGYRNGLLILDRYNLSAMAYGMADGLDLSWLRAIHRTLPAPAHAFLLDIPVEESFRRRPKRADAYEASIERLRKVRQNYLDLFAAGGKTHHVLDGCATPEKITDEIVKIIEGK